MRNIKAIIPKTVAVVDGDERRVDLLDLMDLIHEIQEAAEERRGEKGEAGECGECGPAGKDGRDGINGKDGSPGRDGRDGIDGARGPQGEPGSAGRDGRDGTNGLDGQMPEHELSSDGYGIRFKHPNGSWGGWVRAPQGARGRSGPFGGGGDIAGLVGTRPADDNGEYAASTAWVRAYVASLDLGGGATVDDLEVKFESPIYVNPGEFVAFVAKFIIGTATASQVIWGTATVIHSWE